MKVITNVLNKAKATGLGNVNGRMSYEYGQKGQLESKYRAEIAGDVLTFSHWGTQTLKFNLATGEVVTYYGLSRSDADSLNNVTEWIQDNYGACRASTVEAFHYYPSTDTFILK